jgi:tartrate dehydrogenase/decarboxylase/D-malate dehydrogenase
MRNYKITVIPGRGIGREVVPAGVRVLDAGGRRFDLSFTWDRHPRGCQYYAQTGQLMPRDGLPVDPLQQ